MRVRKILRRRVAGIVSVCKMRVLREKVGKYRAFSSILQEKYNLESFLDSRNIRLSSKKMSGIENYSNSIITILLMNLKKWNSYDII